MFVSLAALTTTVCVLGGCANQGGDEPGSETALRVPSLSSDGRDPVWVYSGDMPKLENVTVYVSVKGHTARVVGDLPVASAGVQLPEYAVVEVVNGTRRVQVAYPIATVAPGGNPNAAAKTYTNMIAYPYNPKGVGSDPNTPWGGFPYIEYERGRNIAFHGPITKDGLDWKLLRGPVSHACNRMQGEHVVELAHIMGIDMKRGWTTEDSVVPKGVKVVVRDHSAYDKVEDGSLANKFVDVDYAPTSPSIAVSISSPLSSFKFKTWDGNKHPEWICTVDQARLDQPKPCSHLGARSTTQPATRSEPSPSLPSIPSSPLSAAPAPKPSPSAGHTANAKVCNVQEFVNVRDNSLGQVIGKALLNEAVEASGETRTQEGITFERVFLFENPALKLPAGVGWIAKDFICR